MSPVVSLPPLAPSVVLSSVFAGSKLKSPPDIVGWLI